MTSKSPEEIQAETQTLWNTLTTPIYDEFLASDQTLSSYNASCQKLKSTYPDFKNVDVIISSFVTTKTYDDNKLNIFKKGLRAAEKSCKIGVTQNQGWIVMEDQT